MRSVWLRSLTAVLTVAFAAPAGLPRAAALAPIHYTFTFPEPQHRWMQVEAAFADLAGAPLELRMSRSSPGRYSLHEFAKNVYDVHAAGDGDVELEIDRPDPYGWTVPHHGTRVVVRYKVYGDRVDGTYLAIDESHAHINMPAAIMWARGFDGRAIDLTFAPPRSSKWRIATQLHPAGEDEYSAPNLQYLMDSPTELGPVAFREFSVRGSRFRVAVHEQATDEGQLDGYARDVEKIVEAEGSVFGEYPAYEPGAYTFILDYVPYASGDGMEHRNSTFISAPGSIVRDRLELLDAVAHEFFHCWNVERIRPAGLEPFDFERANMTDSLWLAEGFTQYYGPLSLKRAGLFDVTRMSREIAALASSVELSPAHAIRSAVDMSRMAPFIDGLRTADRTNFARTVISYYPYGGAIALALDLSLRERSSGRVTLDDFMRAMWRVHGKPGGALEGYVDKPYSLADAEARLAEVAGDRGFARDFFVRYVEGHDVADYARLLEPAGFSMRKRSPGRAWLGDLLPDARGGNRVAALVLPSWPAYAAGIEQDDELRVVDGQRINRPADLQAVLDRHKPGDHVDVVFAGRSGDQTTSSVVLAEDPHLEVVPVEAAGASLTAAQRAFRTAWLGADTR